MAALHLDTPLLRAPPELFGPGRNVWLKMDALQPSGSFKMRGVCHLVQRRVAEGAQAVVCASGGNAGLAATMAARACGVPVTIVVPQSTVASVREAITARGATLIVHGTFWDESHAFATTLAREQGAVYVHPFDDPLLWDGHATLIDEVVRAGVDFDAVVTCVGGGGLVAGIVEGLRRNGRADVPVIAVETEGAASFAAALAAGECVTLPAITSIASSLGARRVTPRLLALAREHEIVSVVVSDAQAVAACSRFADAMRVLVEPACGASLAALDAQPGLFERFRSPLVEVCGGMGVTLSKLAAWRTQFGLD
ncbi:MAG: pyridoxal-phosphate dependent enzyme [Aquincola sp.]|nr:pyridoxal-phosphate dependent enzyme [Aquincola sp.]MDH4289967.1 pyridoxal-phosphate dependent enzyme [Aquincola sp.]MDH5328998.1 pyridoxal-phosphate dependent enzyme [Aquincola sp.]